MGKWGPNFTEQNYWNVFFSVGAVGGDEQTDEDKEKAEEEERERQEAIREAEDRRKEKHRKMEEEREKMRQEIRDKVGFFSFSWLYNVILFDGYNNAMCVYGRSRKVCAH